MSCCKGYYEMSMIEGPDNWNRVLVVYCTISIIRNPKVVLVTI